MNIAYNVYYVKYSVRRTSGPFLIFSLLRYQG